MNRQRIEKYIGTRTDYTRKEISALIKSGRIKINGRVAERNVTHIDADCDTVEIDGTALRREEHIYFMMNKPKGVLSASRDMRAKTVVDLIPDGYDRTSLFPVGRLDKNTTGLIVITNDGELAHRVISPSSKIPKNYTVTLDGEVTDAVAKAFEAGIVLADGTRCMPAELKVSEGDRHLVSVTIYEGKYHQIKRMFGTVGLGVNELKRESIGGLVLDPNLKEGESRLMTDAETAKLNC